MSLIARFGILLAAIILLFPAGIVAQQDQSPQNPQPQTEPGTQPQSSEQQTQPEPNSQSPSATPSQGSTQTAPQASTSPSKTSVKRKRHKPAGSATQSGKVVVRNGGVKEDSVQLAPGMTKEQALHARQNTDRLLASTDANLKSVAGRQLSPGQQSMLDEIHTYVRQAKGASDSGDLTRADTLAHKALLLSDELVKK